MRVDFSNVEDSFEVIDAGKYEASVFEAEEKISKAGNPYINVQFALHGEGLENRRVFGMMSLAPKALWKTKAGLLALGYTKEQLSDPDFDLDVADLVGRECTVVVSVEEYNGKDQNKVSDILEAGNSEAASAEADLYR